MTFRSLFQLKLWKLLGNRDEFISFLLGLYDILYF